VELGLADTEMRWLHVQNDINQIQREGFASPETGAGEQAEDRLESKRQERSLLPGSGSSVEDRLDFSR
jgi:hypothetical protein